MKLTAVIFLTLLCIVDSSVARAQDDAATSNRLLACDALEEPAARLECFNSVVEGLKDPAEPPPAPEVRPAPAPVARTPAAAPEPAPAPVFEPAPASVPEPQAEPAPRPAPVAATPQQDAKPAVKEPRDATGPARIDRVWENHDGRFTVRLDNGEVWRETQGTRVGIPDVGATVEISRSLFGSYRMKIDGIPTIAWVRQRD